MNTANLYFSSESSPINKALLRMQTHTHSQNDKTLL
jgi:hypothetical protein